MSEKNTDKSPNSFEPPKPEGSGSKKTYNLIIGVLAVMALIVVWSLSGTGEKNEKTKEAASEASIESRNLMPGEDAGRGLAGGAYPKPPEKSGLADVSSSKGEDKKDDDQRVSYVGPPTVDKDDESRRQEELQDRRRKREAYYSGLGSIMMVHRSGSPAQADAADSSASSGIPSAPDAPINSEGYDPAADIDKEGFFARADTAQWRSPYTREAGRKYELKTGSIIPGLMVTGVNSDLPGNLIAQVSQNIYDTAAGNHLLIPQGSKIFGAYDSRVVYGQSRVLVAWNRIVFPDGSSVTLGAMPGADLAGYAGFTDKVDNHYLRIFGSAALMSLITGGMSYAMDKVDNNNNNNSNNTTMQDEMASALAAQMGQTTLKMLEKNISIKPTIEIRPGFRFNIVVTKDVVFRGPYVAWR